MPEEDHSIARTAVSCAYVHHQRSNPRGSETYLEDGLKIEGEPVPEGKLAAGGPGEDSTSIWRPSDNIDGASDFVRGRVGVVRAEGRGRIRVGSRREELLGLATAKGRMRRTNRNDVGRIRAHEQFIVDVGLGGAELVL